MCYTSSSLSLSLSLPQEICFSTIAILAYIATCIVYAVNAAAWGEPPALCVPQNGFTKDKDVSCHTIYIGVACVVALQAVSLNFKIYVALMPVSCV